MVFALDTPCILGRRSFAKHARTQRQWPTIVLYIYTQVAIVYKQSLLCSLTTSAAQPTLAVILTKNVSHAKRRC